MIGWINLSVEAFICDSFGRDAWLKIIKQAHVDCNWVSSCPYPDKVTYDLVITGAGILGVTVPQALEAYGQYFVNYVIKQGYTRLLKSLGSNIAEFLANLNNLHLHLTMGFPSMVAPAFRVEQVTSTSLLLHYHSIRPALWPIVSGVLKGASKVLFDHEVEMEVVASREAGDCDHEIFKVTFPHQEALSHWDDHDAALASEYGMTKDFFYELYPFHIILDNDLRVVQAGRVMTRLFGKTLTRGSLLSDTFKMRHPYIPLEYDRMVLEADSLYLFKALLTGLEFKGQMVQTSMPDGRAVLLFLGSPRVANLEEMGLHGLYLSDIPLHDMSRDFVLLAEQRQAEADLKERFETLAVELRVANDRLEQATRWLDEERQRSDALLYRMLPADIAADLREGRKVEAISYPEVTILFSDMVGFTTTSAKSTPEEVYNMLNEMYDKFDGLVDDFMDIYKLETIGDAYFLVCNLTTECHNHVDVVIDFAIRMQERARCVKNAQGEPVQIRIGIHTGPVVGGVLGAKTPRFSIYGDTVNVASRMESHGLPGKIHISDASYNRIVDKEKYAVRERGNIAVKGRGNMTTYLIGGTNDDWLLRHTSFDAQIDGVTGLRDGSFVVTASGRSVESLGPSRQLPGMEAIKEGDEDRPTRTTDGISVGLAASSAAVARLVSGPIGSGTTLSNYSSGQMAAFVAAGASAGGGGGGAGGGGGGAGGSLMLGSAVHLSSTTGGASLEHDGLDGGRYTPGTAALLAEAMGPSAAPGSAGSSANAPAPPTLAAATASVGGGSFRDGSSNLTVRQTSIVMRDNSPVARNNSNREAPVSRDTSFRTVYARAGRGGVPSPLISANSRKTGQPSGAGHNPVWTVGEGDGGSGSAQSGASATGFIAATIAGGTGHGGNVPAYEPSPLSRPEASGNSGFGMPSGIVKARSATSKASALAPVSQSSVTPLAAVVSAAAAPGPSGLGLGVGTGSGLPPQNAVLQQLQVTGLEQTGMPRASSPGGILGSAHPMVRGSEMGASVVSDSGQSTPTGKSKGLAGKLKSLFKK